MAAPKSVVKVTKANGGTVEYTSSVDQAQYYIYELSRAALRDVGKFVKKKWQIAYYNHFRKHTGKGGKATKVKVIAGKSTQYPRVQIGLNNTGDGYYSYFQEFGTSKTPRLGLLSKTVEENVAEIVKIESQYLSGLSGEASALDALIDESDFEDEE